MGTEDSDSSGSGGGRGGGGGGSRARSLALKAFVLFGGALIIKRLRKSTTRWDHARVVAESLCGEKFSREQASRDPDNYFNLRMLICPATGMVDGLKALYFEQAVWRTPSRPFRQRFYMVKPCPKEMKCDVELSSYAIRDAEEYKNFCDRPKDQRPSDDEVIGDIAEHLTTIHLSRCERRKRCLYEGSSVQHHQAVSPVPGMAWHTVHLNLLFTKMVKYILGIGVMMMTGIKYGERREAPTSSSVLQHPVINNSSRL